MSIINQAPIVDDRIGNLFRREQEFQLFRRELFRREPQPPEISSSEIPSSEIAPQSVAAQLGIIKQLRDRIRQAETVGRIDNGNLVTNGCEAIDRLLPDAGYPRGILVQWISGGGHGADYLSLRVAKQACEDGGALVVVDPLNQFYPPAAAAIGINLDNLIVLRSGHAGNHSITGAKKIAMSSTTNTTSDNDLLWAVDQALRCQAVAAVWGCLPAIDERWFRRLQLSAESSGCLGLLVQPPSAARRPSWAEVQWVVGMGVDTTLRQASAPRNPDTHQSDAAFHSDGWQKNSDDCHPDGWQHAQLVRLQLTRCRGTHTGKTINIAINHITGNVQPARREHEQHQRADNQRRAEQRRPEQRQPRQTQSASKPATQLVPVAARLAHPATGRQRA